MNTPFHHFLLLLSLVSLVFNVNAQNCQSLDAICRSGFTCPQAGSFVVNGTSYSYNDFNAISFGDFYLPNGDVEGRIAVQGSFIANQDGVSIGFELTDASRPFSAIIGRDAVWNQGNVFPAASSIFVGGTFTGSSSLQQRVTASCSSSGCLDDQFNTMKQYYQQVSSSLASQAPTTVSAMQLGSVYSINCTGSSSIYYVSVSTSTFSDIMSYSLSNCDASSLFVFNIDGTDDVVFKGREFPSAVVFNVITSTVVNVTATVSGSVLCPNSAFTQIAGYVAGQVVAASNLEVLQINVPCPNNGVPAGPTPTLPGNTATSASSDSSTGSDSASTSSSSGFITSTLTTSDPSFNNGQPGSLVGNNDNNKSSGLSRGGKIALATVLPIVFVIALIVAAILLYLSRQAKRKITKEDKKPVHPEATV